MRLRNLAPCLGLFFSPILMSAQEYFQQEVDYVIDVTLNDQDHVLTGEISMEYQNNSPDELLSIFIHLWPNAYSDPYSDMGKQFLSEGSTKLLFSTEEERGNISGLEFKVNGDEVELEYSLSASECAELKLSTPLAPSESITISTPFVVKIPNARFSRLGHVGESYQITQWYPKPAVYDNKGWHVMPYLNQGEFYSEFGSFDVNITLPENYLVSATGELQNHDEMQVLLQKAESAEGPYKGVGFPPSSQYTKTLRYVQDKVHDFAWFADKRFGVLHETFTLPHSLDTVHGWVFYTGVHSETWEKSMEYVVDGTIHYSKYVGDYPYRHVNVVDGTLSAGGGMEYPMVTVINSTSNDRALEQVIVHEIGHNWFYGILASNERDHAWMDEGINSYYEERYFDEKYNRTINTDLFQLLGGKNKGLQELGYLFNARVRKDQALSLTSEDFTPLNYGAMVYLKGAYIMDHLSSVLGLERFDKAMQEYFSNWGFRHPYPQDMRKSLEESTGEDLDWFFDDLVNSTVKVDHCIHSFDKEKQELKVKSKTDFSGPVSISFFKNDELVEEQIISGQEAILNTSEIDFDKAVIDAERKTFQLNRRNDVIRTEGLLKTWESPQFEFTIGAGLDSRNSLYWMPVLGWNEEDRWMPGLYLSNVELLHKDFEWSLTPLYSSRPSALAGTGNIRQTFWLSPQSDDRLDVSISSWNFSLNQGIDTGWMYRTLKPSITFQRELPDGKKGDQSVNYTYHFITADTRSSDDVIIEVDDKVYHSLTYEFNRDLGITQYDAEVELESNEDYNKLSTVFSTQRTYHPGNKQIGLRLYASKLWTNEVVFAERPSLNGMGTLVSAAAEVDDYRFDHLFLGRTSTSGLTAQQIVLNRGGFTQSSALGSSDNWAASINLTGDLPFPLPLTFFFNYGLYHINGSLNSEKGEVRSLYEGGIRLSLIKNLVDVSYPFILDKQIRDVNGFESDFNKVIRFQLRLEKLNFREIREWIDR